MSVKKLALLLTATVAAGCSAAYAATLSVGSWHLWAGSQTLTKGTCTLTGTAQTVDTYVDERNPTSSFGGTTTMLVGPRTSQRKWALIRFDLTSCNIPSTGGADSATLSVRITTAPGSSRTIDVTPVSTTWDGTLTWNVAQLLTQGATTASFATGTTSNVTKTVTVTADVDDQIKTGGIFGWVLEDNGASSNITTTLGSSNSGTAANRPTLTINYEK
ncbi:MAG TPA: DNRLRE domain-containing protein [Gaiellaceae bacterium]|nr:DNRLRE domain-containing protein [Gaiellaceae bacterium]